jgi:hypothetical protein
MSGTSTAHPPHWAKWKELLQWSPFKIDALGLVTLLGAEEINASVGRLVRSTWFEYLPLLGAFVVAGNSFRSKEAGFNLYNITQGIHTTDMASWLTRWMKSQNFETNKSIVRWTVEPREVSKLERLTGMFLPFCANGMLIAMTILSYDWYGFANAIAMFMSIVVRCYMVASIRLSIDTRVKAAYDKSNPEPKSTWPAALAQWRADEKRTPDSETKQYERPHPLEHGWNGAEPAKILVIMNDAKAVTMLVPRDLLAPPSVFIANLDPANRALYGIARWAGWLSFAVQVVTLGMADLATQIVTVTLLIVPTVLFIAKLGCPDSNWRKNIAWFLRDYVSTRLGDRVKKEYDYGQYWPELQGVSWIGSMLKAEVYEWPRSHEFVLDDKGNVIQDREFPTNAERPISKRQYLYAWLQLSKEEKESMDKWDLFPHERGNNKKWANVYDEMTERTINLTKSPGGRWGVNSVRGSQVTAPPAQPGAVPPPPQPPQAPPIPKLDTKVPKHHVLHSNKPSKEEEEQDTADTAQDGTVLDPNTPSVRSSPADIMSPRTGHRPSVAWSPSAMDIQDHIRPVQRASTVPLAHGRGGRRPSTSGQPSGSAFWMTSRIQQERDSDDSDETISEARPGTGDGAPGTGIS